MTGVWELLIFAGVVAALSALGLWPQVVQALRELRGQPGPADTSSPQRDEDIAYAYRLLGVSPGASWEEIERAYRTKAQKHHPDHGGDGDIMRTLNEAYGAIKKLRKGRR